MADVDADGARKTILYCLGDNGINVIAKDSYHAETVNTLSDNLAVLSDVSSSGMGNEVDVEQIMLWNPEVIIFAHDSIYDSVASDPAWQQVTAVSSGNYYKTPMALTDGSPRLRPFSATSVCSGWAHCSIRIMRTTTCRPRSRNTISFFMTAT